MSRINKYIGFALFLVLAFSHLSLGYSEEYLIRSEDIVVDVANYETITVEKGTYIKTASASAAEYYPIQHAVRYEGATARFVEHNVRRGDEIKKGDLLMTLTVERDEVAISKKQMTLQRAREDYAAGLENYNEEILEKEKALRAETNPFQREKLRLELEKLKIRLEKYRFETENSINDQQKSLDELLNSYANQYIYAPLDGVVNDFVYLRDNQQVYDGMLLMWLYDPSEMLFEVKDEIGVMRYNMEVDVTVGPGKTRYHGKGRVVASALSMPGEPGSSRALIRVESWDTDEPIKNYTRPSVTYNSIFLDNVIVVDKQAVTLFGGKHFVYKLSEDGMVSKRYVNHAAGTTVTGSLLLEGVEVGEKLILD